MAVSARDLTRELEELIVALDRRVPHVADSGISRSRQIA